MLTFRHAVAGMGIFLKNYGFSPNIDPEQYNSEDYRESH
jgi:hypothetical protein